MIEIVPQSVPSTRAPSSAEPSSSSAPATSTSASEGSGAGERGAFAATLLAALGLYTPAASDEPIDPQAANDTRGDASAQLELEPEALPPSEDEPETEDALLELTDLGVGALPLEASSASEPRGAAAPDFQPLNLPLAQAPPPEASASASSDAGSAPSESRTLSDAESLTRLPRSTEPARSELPAPPSNQGSSASEPRIAIDQPARSDNDDRFSDARNDERRATERAANARPLQFSEQLDSAAARPTTSASLDPAARAESLRSGDPTRVLPELPARNESDILEQARVLLQRRGGQAHIELHPPQLGNVGLRISVTDRTVQLEILADRMPVADLLTRHLPELQQALASQGLHVDRASVEFRDRGLDERSSTPGDPNDSRERGSGRGDRPRDDARDSAFERARHLPAYSLGAIDLQA